MGLWNTLKQHAGAQFLDVIEWLDDTNDTIVWRFPVFNQAITDNSKLVVREGQAALFVAEGQLSEVFGPGTYTLDTRNTPIVSFFKSIAYQLQYPYKGDVYFVSTRQFLDNGWGTPRPIMMRDAEFGPVRIRAFGNYSFRITDPAEFLRQIVGTDGLFTTDEISGQLKKKLQSAFAAEVAASKIPVLDLAASYMDFGETLRERMTGIMNEAYGITITDFTIENISLPENVEAALDDRSKMGVLGNLNAYTQLKAAESIEHAAKNTGIGGAGIGMGVGFGMGNMMGNQMGGAMAGGQFNPQTGMQGPPGPPPPPGGPRLHYSGPAGQGEKSLDEIAAAVAANRGGAHNVWMAGWPGWKAWSDVPEIVAKVPPPVAAPPPLPGAAKYHYNGPAGSGEKSLDEVVAALKSDPAGTHHVWQAGWDGWKNPKDVAEIAAKLSAGGPPPPPLPPA
ncbi:MAG: SPFH domain-containing protein [Myxococcota bacterium]